MGVVEGGALVIKEAEETPNVVGRDGAATKASHTLPTRIAAVVTFIIIIFPMLVSSYYAEMLDYVLQYTVVVAPKEAAVATKKRKSLEKAFLINKE